MATGAALDINYPAPTARTRATLLSVARPIPADELSRDGVNRLGSNVTWLPWPDITPTRDEAECETIYDKTARSLPDIETQASFVAWDRLQCGTAGIRLSRLVEMLRLGLDPDSHFLSAQFGAELEQASNATNIDLAGTASQAPTLVASTAVGLDVAIARLENYLAVDSGKSGIRGVIHLTPGLLVLAEADGIVEFRDGNYQTATGTLVVADAGHTGQVAPQGGSTPAADQAWIYATGDIWFAVGEERGVTDATDPDGGPVYVARNQNQPLIERYGLVMFDPNTHAAALVSVAASDGGSGGGGGGDASAANQATIISSIDAGQALATLTKTAPAVGAIATAETLHGFRLYNSHASDAVLIYIRHGDGASDTPFTPVAIAAGESVNVFTGQRNADGEPVGVDGVYVTDESAGAADITDLVGYITTGAA